MRANTSRTQTVSTTVDSLGLVLQFWSTTARVLENERVANKCSSKSKMGKRVTSAYHLGRCEGFDGEPFMQWVMDVYRWIGRVGVAPAALNASLLLSKTVVVEHTFSWLMGCRRLVKYELLPQTSGTSFIYLAMIRVSWSRRLT